MEGTTLRIENSSRAHAESLHELLLTDYETDLVQQDGAWQVEVQLGELAALLLKLFDKIGSWLDAEQVDSLLLHFDERQYTLLRPSKERLHDSSAFLLERVSQLETALHSRIVIEQAKGILARALGVSTDQAFDVLRKAARDRGIKLHDLAATIAASPTQAEALLTGATEKSP
jgi:ANTAR domain-containing protein